MKVGAMNHPGRDPAEEIRVFADMGLDFIDLTLEPPMAGWWQCDPEKIREALQETGMGVVGHTAYYLPIAHPFEEVRHGAVEALCRSLAVFTELGAGVMNVHPDSHAPLHDRRFVVRQNLKSISEVIHAAVGTGVVIMVENLPGNFNTAADLAELLDPLPELGLHLDIGHTELMVDRSTIDGILDRFAGRIRHVHAHDNKRGSADLHLPIGAGVIDIAAHLRALKGTGYDGTVTLEVFTPDPSYLKYSAEKVREMWAGL